MFRYRAPECILTDGYYTYKMDMWSVGCVFFEVMRYEHASMTQPVPPESQPPCLYSLYPLFPGANELDQIAKIHDIMGTPSPAVFAKIRKYVLTRFHVIQVHKVIEGSGGVDSRPPRSTTFPPNLELAWPSYYRTRPLTVLTCSQVSSNMILSSDCQPDRHSSIPTSKNSGT